MNSVELSVELTVRSVDYIINLSANEKNLTIEVQNTETTESWKGSFEKKYIEDLTRKTGNFKSFSIFVNMLQSALNQESSTVTLDLLTYSDLENMRNKSVLNSSNNSTLSRSSTTQNQNGKTNNKKYLIMTYNVEFDRINYPLQLRYQGVMDISSLFETIRSLKSEIKKLQSTRGGDNEFIDYRKEVKRLEHENQALKKENESLEFELKKSTSCAPNKNSDNNVENRTLKELGALKKMMKTFEEDALREKNLYLKQMMKKNEEINQLKNQMNRMIENERNMVNKLRALKDLERTRGSKLNSRSSSKESIRCINYVPLPQQQQLHQQKQRQHKSRLQSNSLDRLSKASSRFQSNSIDRFSRTSRASSRKVSVSPASSTRSKRFDPTEYCRMKKNKLEEINTQKKREIQARMNLSSEDINNSSQKKSSSNRRSNLYSRPASAATNNSSNSRSQAYDNNNYEFYSMSQESSDENCINNQQKLQQKNRQAPKRSDSTNKNYNRDQEMQEINERLKDLHNLLQYSL